MALSTLTLPPCRFANGVVQPPGSKSLANRVLPLAALAKGITTLHNLPDGEDVILMRQALFNLNTKCTQIGGSSLRVEGPSGPWQNFGQGNINQAIVLSAPDTSSLPQPFTDVFLGNSGTSTRILTALLCGAKGRFKVDGVARMRERPIADLVSALQPICANKTQIAYTLKAGYPPLEITAQGLEGGKTVIKGDISSQFLTGLLLALPLCEAAVEVEVKGHLVSSPYVAMTLAVMKSFGVTVENQGFSRFYLASPTGYLSPGDYIVEPDASSASYFLAAGAIAGGQVTVTGIGKNSLQGEAAFATVLERMGAQVEWKPNSITVGRGANPLQGLDADMDLMSDTGMTLAMVACFAKGRTLIRNIGNWRVKETDRIFAMATELRKIGATVEEGPDWLGIDPPVKFLSARIETYDDHRMAMCFSLACLGGATITLEDPECVGKTYPGYFEALSSMLRVGDGPNTPQPEFSLA